MTVQKVTKWFAGLVAAGIVLLLLSIFVADRHLDPPFEAAELGPIEIPAGDPSAPETIYFSSDRSGTFEIYARPGPNAAWVALTDDKLTDSWRPRVSPDGRTVLFYRTPAAVADSDLTLASLWMVGVDGGGAIEVLPPRSHGWTRQGHAEWSPLGNELVMMGARPKGKQIWVTSLDGRDIRNLVNADGDNIDPSWSPDAKRILYSACAVHPCEPSQREVFAILASGGEPLQLTRDDVGDDQPAFSPDGRQIMMRSLIAPADAEGERTVWAIRIVPTDRSRPPRELVRASGLIGSAAWLDDQTALFHQDVSTGGDGGIFAIRPASGEVEVLIDNPSSNELFPDAN